ncbi:MAG TPA: c-type cytochrome [Terriglobales bacterium]|nr:c-type cytochrome [Terriglobales bacterium]
MLRTVAALTAGALFFVGFANAFSQEASSVPPPQKKLATHPQRPMPKPTNLQVLPKDIAVPDLLALMRSYTAAMGVECEFCHAADPKTHKTDFASDAKPDKGIARIMITMTKEINAKYMSQINDPDATPADKAVTCGTCHQGNSMPMPFAASKRSAPHGMDDESGKKPD